MQASGTIDNVTQWNTRVHDASTRAMPPQVLRECKGQLLIVTGLLHHRSVVTQIIFTLKAARSVFPSLSEGNVTN